MTQLLSWQACLSITLSRSQSKIDTYMRLLLKQMWPFSHPQGGIFSRPVLFCTAWLLFRFIFMTDMSILFFTFLLLLMFSGLLFPLHPDGPSLNWTMLSCRFCSIGTTPFKAGASCLWYSSSLRLLAVGCWPSFSWEKRPENWIRDFEGDFGTLTPLI